MRNMSYCRFYNTLSDLRDCYENLNEQIESEDEREARRKLIELCKRIAEEADEDTDEEDSTPAEYRVPAPFVYIPSVYTQEDLDNAITKGLKIEAIKAYRYLHKDDEVYVGLWQAKEAVEALMEAINA